MVLRSGPPLSGHSFSFRRELSWLQLQLGGGHWPGKWQAGGQYLLLKKTECIGGWQDDWVGKGAA